MSIVSGSITSNLFQICIVFSYISVIYVNDMLGYLHCAYAVFMGIFKPQLKYFLVEIGWAATCS